MPAAGILYRVWEPEAHTHTPQTQQAKEQVKTECTQTQECERYMRRNPIYKLKHGGLVGVQLFSQKLFQFCFLLASVCSKFQTSTKEPDQQPLETKVLVCPKKQKQ